MKKTKYLPIGIGVLLLAQSCSIWYIKDPHLDRRTISIAQIGKKKILEKLDSIKIFGKKEDIRALMEKRHEVLWGKEVASFFTQLRGWEKNAQYDLALQSLQEKLSDEKWEKYHDWYWSDYVKNLFQKGERKRAREIADSLIKTQDEVIRMLNGSMHFQLAIDACLDNDYERAKPHYEKSWYRKPLVDYLGKSVDSLFPSRDIDFLREKGVWNDGTPKFITIWTPG